MALELVGTNVLAYVNFFIGVDLLGCFLYGSYARGTHTPTSDLDCFVVTNKQIEDERIQYLRAGFITLQESLGFQPDVEFPIEVFTLDACERLLASPSLLELIDAGWRQGYSPVMSSEDDAVEMLRALISKKVVLCGPTIVKELEEAAWLALGSGSLAERHSRAQILEVFGKELKCEIHK